jgi:Ceramidase
MRPIILFFTLLVLCVVALLLQKPIAQSLDYHNFIDNRTLLGFPNFWNVVSNLPFFFIGCYGLRDAAKYWEMRPNFTLRSLSLVLNIGILATSFGSAYYHWSPNNDTLVWDRLPMTLMFMALLGLIVYDFCGEKAGTRIFWIALVIGILSVWYWNWTEQQGAGDLRPYVLVQFFPLMMFPLLFAFYAKKVNYGRLILGTSVFYILAKLCEHFDTAIFDCTQHTWSGHTIKHLLAGVALLFVVKLLKTWRVNSAEE